MDYEMNVGVRSVTRGERGEKRRRLEGEGATRDNPLPSNPSAALPVPPPRAAKPRTYRPVASTSRSSVRMEIDGPGDPSPVVRFGHSSGRAPISPLPSMNTLSLGHHPTPSSDPTHTPSRSSLLSTRSKSNKATVGAKSSSILSKQPDLSTSSKRPLANRFELENNEKVVSPASISVYQELRRIYDLSVQGVPPEFRKISDLVRHVNSFSRTVDRTGLASCRVVLVNTGSESKQGAGREGVNDTSHELINLMSSIVHYGGILVAPEDFTPSPSNTLNTDDDRTRRRAEEENWTTHVVASSPSARKTPTFAEVLNCLGRKGIAVEELGCYVRVVRKQWVTFAKMMGSKGMETFLSCEGAHLIRPDLRDQIKQRSTPQAAPLPQPLPSPKVEKVARESGRSRRGHISSGQETSEGVSDDSDDWWQTRKVVRHAFDESSQPPPGSFVTQVDKKNLRTPKKLFNEIVAKRCCRRKGGESLPSH